MQVRRDLYLLFSTIQRHQNIKMRKRWDVRCSRTNHPMSGQICILSIPSLCFSSRLLSLVCWTRGQGKGRGRGTHRVLSISRVSVGSSNWPRITFASFDPFTIGSETKLISHCSLHIIAQRGLHRTLRNC